MRSIRGARFRHAKRDYAHPPRQGRHDKSMIDIDWKKLKDARGASAARVPGLIKKLTSSKREVRVGAFNDLAAALYRVGEWLDVGEAAVPSLLAVAVGRSPRRFPAFWLLTNILCGHHVPVAATGLIAPTEASARVAKAIGEQADGLCKALSAKPPEVRSAAAHLLAFLPALAASSVPLLQRSAAAETHEGAKASMLCALGLLGRCSDVDVDLGATGAVTGDLASGAAGAAEFLLTDEAAGLAERLALWVRVEPDPESFPWCDGRPFSLLVEFAKNHDALKPGLVAALCEQVEQGKLADAERASVTVFGILGLFDRCARNETLRMEQLDESELAFARATAFRDDLRSIGWGLPASARVRRRWLGIDAAGPLENEITLESSGTTGPVWALWRGLARESDGLIPEPIAAQLSAAEAYGGALEVMLDAYGIHSEGQRATHLDAKVLWGLMEAAGDEAVPHARRAAEELAPLLLKAPSQDTGGAFTRHLSSPLDVAITAPLVRAGIAIESAWLHLVPWSPADRAREVLQAVPEQEREALVFERLVGAFPRLNMGIAGKLVVPILDLVPSARIAERATRILDDPVSKAQLRGSAKNADQLLAEIEALAEREPGVREGLTAARS